MLTTLERVKARLALIDTQYDELLTGAIGAASGRFERECNRVFGRGEGVVFEFPADETEVLLPRYPVESVSKWEYCLAGGEPWVEQAGVIYAVRGGCVLSLGVPLCALGPGAGVAPVMARVTFTGGYVLPADAGSAPEGAALLPSDLENACVEQVAAWYLHRDFVGEIRHWPKDGIYMVFDQLPFLPGVAATLARYRRWVV